MGTGGLHAHPQRALTATAASLRPFAPSRGDLAFPASRKPPTRPHAGQEPLSRGESLMTRLRYQILAGTALALILAAIPLGSLALDARKPAPAAMPPAAQTST